MIRFVEEESMVQGEGLQEVPSMMIAQGCVRELREEHAREYHQGGRQSSYEDRTIRLVSTGLTGLPERRHGVSLLCPRSDTTRTTPENFKVSG